MSKKVLNDFDLPNEGDIIDRIANEQERVKCERSTITKASQIKEKSDFIALLRQFGIEVRKNGRSYMALCPFHKDTKPSLSIDPEKKLFHCFGCERSGDVIEFVKLYKGTDFQHALSILNELSPSTSKRNEKVPSPSLPASAGMILSQPKTTIVPPPPLSQGELHTLLNAVGEHYHKTLLTNQKAQEYLKKRDLMDAELIHRFTIGYCDCTLLQKISHSQKEALRTAGIFTSSGTEHFKGCIVVPVFKENGQIGEMYGRRINDTEPKHLYLPGPHEGLFHYKAMKVYDEIILVESIFDALSLIQLGFENTIALYGLNGYTEDHRKGLMENRIKKVIIAFDNDDAGRKGAERLKKLLPDEVSASFLFPPRGKDWNEELVMGTEREVLKEMMEEAEVYKPEKEQQGLEGKREGSTYRFRINEITYRLIGVKEVFVQNLRVKIKARYQEERFYDTVDLYSSRGRESYSGKVGGMFGVEPKRVEKDLIRILEYLEEERDRKLGEYGERPGPPVLSEEEKEVGMEFLKSPDLFERIEEDMSILGYVAEGVNKLIVYLAAISRFLPTPLNVYLQSVSSGGKSALLSTLERMIPPEDVIKALTMSHQALHYVEEEEFIDKVFIMGEDIHDEGIEGLVRQMQSEGEISRLVTVKDEKSGEMRARLIRKEAKMSFMVTSTALSLNAENASRCLVLYADESAGQTKKVQERLGRTHSWEGQVEEESEVAEVVKRHRAAQRLLQKVKVFNPLWKYLRFPTRRPSMRRAYDQFLTLIDAICFLRQKQKEEVKRVNQRTGEEVRGIECDVKDYRLGYRLFTEGVLRHGAYDLSSGTRRLYESIREMVREGAEREGVKVREVSFIQKQVREYTQLGVEYVKKHLRELVEYEYVEVQGGRRHGTRYCYRLREDKGIEEMDISEIPGPEEVEERIRRESEETGYEGRSGDN